MGKRIDWSAEEKETVMANYHLHRMTGLKQRAALEKAVDELPHSRRRPVHAAFLWTFNKEYLTRDEFKLDIARAKLKSPEQNGHSAQSNSDRIRWTEEEVKMLAEKWVWLRLEHPYEGVAPLLEMAQRAVLPGDRQRSVSNLNTSMTIMVNRLLKEAVSKLKAIHTPPPPPEPQIITLEIPRKLTVAEMLAALDEPILEGLLSAKRLSRETAFHEILRGIAAQAGATNLPAVAKFVPRLEVFDHGQKRQPRIAIVGVPEVQWPEIQTEIANAKLDVALRFPGTKDSLAIERSDFAIIYRGPANDAALKAVGDRTIGQIGRERVALIDDSRTDHVLQQVRNFCSRQ